MKRREEFKDHRQKRLVFGVRTIQAQEEDDEDAQLTFETPTKRQIDNKGSSWYCIFYFWRS